MREDTSGFAFGTFLTGVTVGAALAMLFAPQTGEETRELLADHHVDPLRPSIVRLHDQTSSLDRDRPAETCAG